MPINDSSAYPEKLSKSSAVTATSSGSTSKTSTSDNALIKYQGQKWQQFFDFEKLLKQIRIAEKQISRSGKSDSSSFGSGASSSSGSSNGKSSSQPSVNVKASSSSGTTSTLRCSRQQWQVQRLHGGDMHYYGIVPKQTALDVVVCSVCRGIYTKVGFNNHMMLQHPSVWSTVSTKLSSAIACEAQPATNDNSQDSVRELPAAGEVAASPSDFSGTMSTCSNASSSSTVSSTYATTPRHKSSSSKNSSSAPGSSARSRSSKSKHHHHQASSTASTSSSSVAHPSSSSTSSSNNNNTATAAAEVTASSGSKNAPTAAAPTSASTLSTPAKEATADVVQPITIYSSSSNSSCSLPPTPKMVSANMPETAAAAQESAFTNNLILLNDAEDATKLAAEKASVPPSFATVSSIPSTSSKKKAKSPSFVVHKQEPIDSSTSSSSGEFERINAAPPKSVRIAKKPPMCGKDLKRFDTHSVQISELDQAVSSITGGIHGDKAAVLSNEKCMEAEVEVGESAVAAEQLQAAVATLPTAAGISNYQPQQQQQQQEMVHMPACDEPMPQNTSDDNSILTLVEDMFDSKFINDILYNESEIHFDENELDPATAQQQTYAQPPASKRMRYDESALAAAGVQQTTEIANGDFTMYQQQQQPQQQQYSQYDAGNLGDIKVYSAEQLQQLLYNQQQNMGMYDGQQQQFSQTAGLVQVNSKQIIDLCAEEDLQKAKVLGVHPMEVEGGEYDDNAGEVVAAHFQVFNVPSLTDDVNDAALLMQTNGGGAVDKQYVLPANEEHLIYEITANNPVAVMSQQQQQQVIAEFLTQAGYEHVEGVSMPATAPSANNTSSEYGDLLDFDFTHIETAKPVSSSGGGSSASSKSEHAKYDDYYFNVTYYAGIPRPLAINNFGLKKLPLSVATTFRKHLLTTRKANNSPVTLSGGMNGVVGGSNVGASARLSNVNTKSASSYFTTLSGSGNTGSGNANEFSIGSITITNSQHSPYAQQKQQQNSALEITFNSATNGSVRPKAGGALALQAANSSAALSAKTKSPTTRPGSLQLQNSAKTISATAPANATAVDRIKFVKRSLIAKAELAKPKSKFSPKQLAELLGMGKTSSPKHQPHSHIVQENSQDLSADEQTKLSRVHHFYEHRRKLLNISKGNSQLQQNQHQAQPQVREKLLKQQQLFRNLSDCGINSIAHNKSNNPTASGDNIMRVFV